MSFVDCESIRFDNVSPINSNILSRKDQRTLENTVTMLADIYYSISEPLINYETSFSSITEANSSRIDFNISKYTSQISSDHQYCPSASTVSFLRT